jgi:hypothetical protein
MRQEEKRLGWLNSSPLGSVAARVQTAVSLAQATEKLHNAERELAALENSRR